MEAGYAAITRVAESQRRRGAGWAGPIQSISRDRLTQTRGHKTQTIKKNNNKNEWEEKLKADLTDDSEEKKNGVMRVGDKED